MKRSVALALALSVSLSAQAPIPKVLKEAKTAFLINDGAGEGTYQDLAKELQKWGRWELVDEAGSADITITIGGLKAFKGWPITIVSSADKTPLYSDKQKKQLFTNTVAEALVKHLRETLEGKQKK